MIAARASDNTMTPLRLLALVGVGLLLWIAPVTLGVMLATRVAVCR